MLFGSATMFNALVNGRTPNLVSQYVIGEGKMGFQCTSYSYSHRPHIVSPFRFLLVISSSPLLVDVVCSLGFIAQSMTHVSRSFQLCCATSRSSLLTNSVTCSFVVCAG